MRGHDARAALTADQERAADGGLKAMIPVGRPFLDYVLSGLADAGVREACVVIGPAHDEIRRHYAAPANGRRLDISFCVQPEPRGTADALLAARDFAGSAPFLALNADNYYPVDAYRALAELGEPALAGFDREALTRLGNIPPERIRQFALIHVGADGYLSDIEEKPDEPTAARLGDRALVSMNLWSFRDVIFTACERLTPSSRGELELPEAVRYAMRELGARWRVVPFALGVLDLSRRVDIAALAERLRGVEAAP